MLRPAPLIVLLLTALSFGWFASIGHTQTRDTMVAFPTAVLDIETASGTQSLNIELAMDPQRWQQGLMFREELADYSGMLFVFPRPQVLSFWMKNTLIPLDMIFADSNGKIVHIVYNAEPETLDGRSSEVPAQLVLEVYAGRADALNIQVGDQMVLPVSNIQDAPQSL